MRPPKHPARLSRPAARLAFAALTLILILFTYSCEKPVPVAKTPKSAETDFSLPGVNSDPAVPLSISGLPADNRLCRRVNTAIAASDHPQARWGLFAFDLNAGKVICAKDSEQLLIPASTQKLITASAALDLLGPRFRWKTSVLSSASIRNGVLDGDLVLYGGGAPDLDKNGLRALAGMLKKAGLERVKGDIVGDESRYRGDPFGDGWTWNTLQWYYGAAASALSLDRNAVRITIRNGRPTADSRFIELSGSLIPTNGVRAVGIMREPGGNKIFVWGEGSNFSARVAVNEPALFAAKTFRELLGSEGIRVDGRTLSANWRSDDRADPDNSNELAFLTSGELRNVVRAMNMDSVNLYAELLLRELGKRFGSGAPDPDPRVQKLRGDGEAGAAVLRKWLSDKGLLSGRIAIHDGSGLSRLDSLNPETLGRVLIYGSTGARSKDFIASLPVAGKSGTLRHRLRSRTGRIAAKTGSTTYVGSLAGYVRGRKRSIAFVLICNDPADDRRIAASLDRVASVLAE